MTLDYRGDVPSARIAVKYISDCKIVALDTPWRDPELGYEIFMNHLKELQEVYESFIDEESRRTFYGYWLGNISHQFKELIHSKNSHYFATGFMPESGDVVIDIGVLDGGTSVKFLNLGCQVYGFEMNKENFEIAKKVADEKGFIVENLALDNHTHEVKYNPSGGATRMSIDGNEKSLAVTLDDYVCEKDISHVDFLKLDVEGAELNVLQGATTTISRFKPILAISAYHKWNDFWTLMNFIKSIRQDYEWALRQFASKEEDIIISKRSNNTEMYDFLSTLELEPDSRGWEECVLFAR